MTTHIKGFQGDYRWLSNFWECKIPSTAGVTFPSVEAAYQACKLDPGLPGYKLAFERFALMSPGQAKAAGKTCKLRRDWDKLKQNVMLKLVRLKFGPANPELRAKLLATGTAHLEEANNWGDRYWGTVNGVGQNVLGLILMQVRTEIREAQT